jgi:hypothetical protein
MKRATVVNVFTSPTAVAVVFSSFASVAAAPTDVAQFDPDFSFSCKDVERANGKLKAEVELGITGCMPGGAYAAFMQRTKSQFDGEHQADVGEHCAAALDFGEDRVKIAAQGVVDGNGNTWSTMKVPSGVCNDHRWRMQAACAHQATHGDCAVSGVYVVTEQQEEPGPPPPSPTAVPTAAPTPGVVSELLEQLQSINDGLVTVEEDVGDMSTAVDDLAETVGANTEDIQEQEGALAALRGDMVEQLRNTNDGLYFLRAEVGANTEDIQEQERALSALGGDMVEQLRNTNDSLDDLKEELDGLTPRVEAIESYFAENPNLAPVIPGAETIGRGFNLDSGLLGPQVLVSTFQQGKSFQYDFDDRSAVYAVPDHTNQCGPWRESGQVQSSSRFASFEDWQQAKASGLGIKTGFAGLFGASHSAEASSFRRTFAEEGTFVYQSSLQHGAFECITEVDLAPYASDVFTTAVDDLPKPFDEQDESHVSAYRGFFDGWGAYIVDHVYTGGMVDAVVTMAGAHELEERWNSQTTKSYAAFKLLSWGAGGGYAETELEAEVLATMEQHSTTSISVQGGDRSNFANVASWLREEVVDWANSVKESPKTVFYRLTAISAAVEDEIAKRSIEVAIEHFYGTRLGETATVDELRRLVVRNKDTVDQQFDNLQRDQNALVGEVTLVGSDLDVLKDQVSGIKPGCNWEGYKCSCGQHDSGSHEGFAIVCLLCDGGTITDTKVQLDVSGNERQCPSTFQSRKGGTYSVGRIDCTPMISRACPF